jgi:DNA-binding transcriptional LysR family regulator
MTTDSIGLLPCFVGDHLPGISPVLKISDTLPIDIWLVTAATNRKRPKVQAFFQFFAAKLRDDESRFIGKPYLHKKK